MASCAVGAELPISTVRLFIVLFGVLIVYLLVVVVVALSASFRTQEDPPGSLRTLLLSGEDAPLVLLRLRVEDRAGSMLQPGGSVEPSSAGSARPIQSSCDVEH